MQTTATAMVNGVDTEALAQTVTAIRQQPAIAGFKFRARNRAISGGLNRSEIKEFHGAMTEHRGDAPAFVVENAEPPVLLGQDQAPNPVEYVIQALLACMTTTTLYKAAAKGITIDSIRSEVEGDLDLHGMFGMDPDVRPGFQELRARLVIKTSGNREAVRNLHKFSPVYDTLARPVPIKVEVVFED